MDKDMVNPKTIRSEVYHAINTEREYQAKVAEGKGTGEYVGHPSGTIPKSVGDYMIMMERYMDIARQVWVSTPGSADTLHVIRKIAGIAVKCMEQHGAPVRIF